MQPDRASQRHQPIVEKQPFAESQPIVASQAAAEIQAVAEPDRIPGAWQTVLATSQTTPSADDASDQSPDLVTVEEDHGVESTSFPAFAEPDSPPKNIPDGQLELRVQEEVARQMKLHALEQQASDNTPNVRQTAFESAIPEADLLPNLSPSSRVSKPVRKVNWKEIEMSPIADAMTSFSPQQLPVLKRQRANPQVESRAREHIQYGESLARRRSFFAAREEFIRALLLISSSYKTDPKSGSHPERFAQALTAIEEASDFTTLGGEANSGLALQQIILSHKTKLLAPQDIETTTPKKAFGTYIRFAQNQIEQAIGYSVAGSEALHALGKLESLAPEANANLDRTRQAKALIFFRTAININPSNSVCANDLGVLLFKMGRLQEAETALKASLRSSPSQLGWSNLASVHSQLAAAENPGQRRNYQLSLANMAAGKAQAYSSNRGESRQSDNQWATASEFQNNAAFPDVVLQRASSGTAENAPVQSTNKPSLMKKVKGWF